MDSLTNHDKLAFTTKIPEEKEPMNGSSPEDNHELSNSFGPF